MRDHTRTIKEIAEMVGQAPKAVDAWARYNKIAPEGLDLQDNKSRLFDPTPFVAHYCPELVPKAINIPDECLEDQDKPICTVDLGSAEVVDNSFMVPPLTPEIIAAYLQVFDRDGVQNILINNYGLNPYRTEE